MDNEICKVQKEKDVTVLTLTMDNITMYQNEDFKKAFSKLLDEGAKKIVVDMSGTDFISSLVLASLVSILKKTKEKKGDIILCGIKDKIKEILSITGLDSVFTIVDDKKKALSSFSK